MPVATLLTPRSPGAIAILQIHATQDDGADLALLLATLNGGAELAVGAMRLIAIAEIDTVLVARPSRAVLQIMPHGGVRIVQRLLMHLAELGVEIREPEEVDPSQLFPEAADRLEARMLAALASASSPRAIDLLLDQPRRWRRAAQPVAPAADPSPDRDSISFEPSVDAEDLARSRRLNRLLHPPRVVIVGAANIGKSTLVNRLAGRTVAITADLSGTTRDVVVVPLVLDGLALWWHDPPGISPAWADHESNDEGDDGRNELARIEREAGERAARVIAAAEFVIAAADVAHDWPTIAECAGRAPDLRVTLRADLGSRPGSDLELSVVEDRGIEAFAVLVRQRLVPDADLEHPGRWKFFG